MDSEDLDENILLNSDDEESGNVKHSYHNTIDEEELLYEGDEDEVLDEAEDVLELALEDDELDTPDHQESNELSPVKVRTTISGHAEEDEFAEEETHIHEEVEEDDQQEELLHEEYVDDNNESPPSSSTKQTLDSDDDDDSPRTRGRFLTERKTEDIPSKSISSSSGGGGGGSEGMPITSLGGGHPRPPFHPDSRRGGRGGFNNNMNRQGHHQHGAPRSFAPPRFMNPNLRHRQPSLLGSGPRPALLRYPSYNQQMQALHNEAALRQLPGGFIDFSRDIRPQGKQNQLNNTNLANIKNKVPSPKKPPQLQQQQLQEKQNPNQQKVPLINSPQQQKQLHQQQQQQQQPSSSQQQQPIQSNVPSNQQSNVLNNPNLNRNPNANIQKRPLAPRVPQNPNNIRLRPRIPGMANQNPFLNQSLNPGQQQQQRPPLRPQGHRQRHPMQQNRPHFPGQQQQPHQWRPNSPLQQQQQPRGMPPQIPGPNGPIDPHQQEQPPFGNNNFPGQPILMGGPRQPQQHLGGPPPNFGPNDPNCPPGPGPGPHNPNNFPAQNIRQPFMPPMQHQFQPPQPSIQQQQQPPHNPNLYMQQPPQQQFPPHMQEPIPPPHQNNPFFGARPDPEMHRISQQQQQMNYNQGGRNDEFRHFPPVPPGQVHLAHPQEHWPVQGLPPPPQVDNMGMPPQYHQQGEMRPPLHFHNNPQEHYPPPQQQQPHPSSFVQGGRRVNSIAPDATIHHEGMGAMRHENRYGSGSEINDRPYDSPSYHHPHDSVGRSVDFSHERDRYDYDDYDSYDRHHDKIRYRGSPRSDDYRDHHDHHDHYDRPPLKRTAEFKDELSSPEKRLQGRLGPPVPKRRTEDPRKEEVIKIIKESQKVMGLDAEYLAKMEEQKRLRDRILREKEERRKNQQLSAGGEESSQGQNTSSQNTQSHSPPRPGPSAKSQVLRREVRLSNKGTMKKQQQQQGGSSASQSVPSGSESNVKLRTQEGKPATSSKSIYVNPKAFKGDLSVLNSNLKMINMNVRNMAGGAAGSSSEVGSVTKVSKVVSSTSTTKKTNTSKVHTTTTKGLPQDIAGIGPTTKKKTILRIVRNKKGEIISKSKVLWHIGVPNIPC